MKLALGLAEQTKISTPLAKKTQEIYMNAVNEGYGNNDFSVIYKYLSKDEKD